MDEGTRYDPVTLFHWLWWRVKCLEASGDAFQKLFEDVTKRADGMFMGVRPYGSKGDFKCDGMFLGDGVVFQVYSPDEMKEKDTVKKIEEDLSGAVRHWGEDLKKWVFVYNVRRGVPPDVPKMLAKQRRKHRNIVIEPMSSDALWDIVRDLSVQKRSEILGAPPGYEALFMMPNASAEEIRELLGQGRFMLIQDVLSPINALDAARALEPERPFGAPLFLRPARGCTWTEAAEYQATAVGDVVERSRDLAPRFAVFSFAPIPLAIHLGHLLSDRVDVRLFQFDRDHKTMVWPSLDGGADASFVVKGLPTGPVSGEVEAVIRVSLSATISPGDTRAAAGVHPVEVDLAAREPGVTWLQSPDQLVELARVFRDVLADVCQKVPGCRRLHLFYAGPAGGAVALGQAINPRMTPAVALYEYDRKKAPAYERVLELA